jgi:hypothetical protein
MTSQHESQLAGSVEGSMLAPCWKCFAQALQHVWYICNDVALNGMHWFVALGL